MPACHTVRWLQRPTGTAPGGDRIQGGGGRPSTRLWAARPPHPPEAQEEEEEEAAVADETGVRPQQRERRPRSSPSVLGGFTRNDALSALGVAGLTGLAIATARPDQTTLAADAAAAIAGGRGMTVPQTSSVIAAKKGYLGWRRLSDVEARAKDQNKGQKTYPVRFVAYLTRFLLNFDEDDKALWARLAREIPFTYPEQKVDATRRAQFAALADSVEIGLYDYQVMVLCLCVWGYAFVLLICV